MRCGITSFVNLYGKRLFKIKNDDIISRSEKEGDVNIFYFYNLEMLSIDQDVSATRLSLSDSFVNNMVLYASDTYKVTISSINLCIATSKADNLVQSILDLSFIEEDNDLLHAFEDIKQCLHKYIQHVEILITEVNVLINNTINVEINDISIVHNKVSASSARIGNMLLIDNIVYQDNKLSIDKLVFDSQNKTLFDVYLNPSDDTTITDVSIKEIIVDDLRISCFSISNNVLTISSAESEYVSVHDVHIKIDNDITWLKQTTYAVRDLPKAKEWCNNKLDMIKALTCNVHSDSETKISIKDLKVKVTQAIHIEISVDEATDSCLNEVLLVTEEWKACIKQLEFSDDLVIHQADVDNALVAYQWIKALDLSGSSGENTSKIIVNKALLKITHLSNTLSALVSFSYDNAFRDVNLSCFINQAPVVEFCASILSDECIVENISVTLDPYQYDLICKLSGLIDTQKKAEPSHNQQQVLSESMIINSYINEEVVSDDDKSVEHNTLLYDIITDYYNEAEKLFEIKIHSMSVALSMRYGNEPFLVINLDNILLQKTHDLEASMVGNVSVTTSIRFKIDMVDTSSEDDQWKRFVSCQEVSISYSVNDDDYDATIYCKKITANIREQTLLKLLSFFTPRSCVTGKSKVYVSYLSIGEIPISLSFLPIITSGIPSLSIDTHETILPAIKVNNVNLDSATDAVKTRWLSAISTLHIVSNIKAIKPYASHVYDVYRIVSSYLSKSSNTAFLRSFIQRDYVSYIKRIGMKISDMLV